MKIAFSIKKLGKGVPWIILGLGCALSAWVALYVDQQITRDARNLFHQHVRDFDTALDRHFDMYDNILFGIAGMYQTTDDVSPEQFHQYGDSLRIPERYSALKSVNFARHVNLSDDGPMRQVALADAAIIDAAIARDASRTRLMVITRIYPAKSPGLGVDLFTNYQKHFAAIPGKKIWLDYQPNKVLSTGLPVQRAGQPQAGLAARLGIFEKQANGQSRLIGTAGIGFDLKRFFAEAVPQSLATHLHFQMVNVGRVDGQIPPQPILVFDSNGGKIGGAPRNLASDRHLSASFDIVFGGALLRTTVSKARRDLISVRDYALPFFTFAAGALLSGLLALLSSWLRDQNAFLRSAIKKKNADLQLELQQKRALEWQLAHSADEERRHIGRELHDDLGQRLTGISLSAEILNNVLRDVAPALAAHADALERETSQAISCVRNLAHGLIPVPSGAQGLREALDNLARDVSALTNIACSFDYEDPVDIDDENVATNLYRIAQEALNNAIRHGKASRVSLHLDHAKGKVVLSIADNGTGFDPAGVKRGSHSGAGLNIMRHRASVSGYALSIESAIGHGTTIKVKQC